MNVGIEESGTALERFARARSWEAGRYVAALQIGDDEPVAFVGDEVIVDAEDHDLIERMRCMGGRIVRDVTDPEMPEEFRRAGMGRDRLVDPTGLPRSVKIRFDHVPETDDVRLDAYLDRADLNADRVRYSSKEAARLTALIAPMRAEGRGVWMNEVGTDNHTLPLRRPAEGISLAFNSDPLTWPSMTGRFRIADAWQLIETLRLTRSGGGGPVFICICDSGFWFDAPNMPGSAGAQTLNDLGTGTLRWNAVEDVGGVPSGPGRKNWHGTVVASAAAAVVGNATGAAGAGGSVAVPCYFHDDRSADSAKTTMIRCAQWGIPLVVYSGTFTSVEFFFGTSSWNDTFNWAANNGVLMIAAAGNDDISLPDDRVLRPATRTPRSLTVGAVNDDGTKADFSNHGSSVRLWAPGVNVPVVPTASTPTGSTVSGTSIAAPLVAGVAAMMRFANPSLTVDQLRDTLVNTGWDGGGAVSKGLDAYAAVWAAMATRMTETSTESAPERLYPRADGSFEPIFNSAINHRGDRDDFLLDVASFSWLEIEVQWYERLSFLSVFLESTDPDATDPNATVTTAPGRATLSAALGSGRYRIRVRGTSPTAYLLSGRLRPGTLAPDAFEPNDSFETATRLRVRRERLPRRGEIFDLGVHGPGSFDLTLHSAGTGPGTKDQDFFHIKVPAGFGALDIPQILVGSDEPVDVTVYDEVQQPLHTYRAVRSAKLPLGEGRTYFVRVAGATHTRYSLWVGVLMNLEALRRSWQEELRIIPDWWEDVHPDWVSRPEELRGIVLGEQILSDGQLTLGDPTTGILPSDVRMELLDDAGHLVREAAEVAGRRSFDLVGLPAGPYVVRITSDTGASFAVIPQRPLRGTSR